MRWLVSGALALPMAAIFAFAGCGSKSDPGAEAPPAPVVYRQDPNIVQVDHPERFPVVAGVEHDSASQLTVTGTINPDVSRTVPVVSLAAGRVVDVKARLGDEVKKGDLLLQVQSADVSGAFSDYHKAQADETLAHTQFERAKDLNAHGAISTNDFQVAQDAYSKAQVDSATAAEHLRLLGNDPDHPSGIVNIYAPISGVITDQEITTAAGVQGLSSPNPFTISDLSDVWVLCDVHEPDLLNVHVGESADVQLAADPDRTLKGTISNVGAILDPTIRTAKVRIELRNPGFLRPGMFATVTFHGSKKEKHVAVPASAILHLHDRDWVFVAAGGNQLRRVEVTSGVTLPGNMQEVLSGIEPGTRVVEKALLVENTVEQ